MIPHPVHAIRNLEQRHESFLAESAREQRAGLAERGNDARSRRQLLDLMATLAFLVALVVLVASGVLTAPEPTMVPVAAIVLP